MKTLATYQQEARRELEILERPITQMALEKFTDDLISRTFSEIEKEVVARIQQRTFDKLRGATSHFRFREKDGSTNDYLMLAEGIEVLKDVPAEAFARIRGDEKCTETGKCPETKSGCYMTCDCPCHSSPSEEKPN